MPFDDLSRAETDKQSRPQAEQRYRESPVITLASGYVSQPFGGWGDRKGAGDDQPTAEQAFAKPSATGTDWHAGEDQGDQNEVDEERGGHRDYQDAGAKQCTRAATRSLVPPSLDRLYHNGRAPKIAENVRKQHSAPGSCYDSANSDCGCKLSDGHVPVNGK